ncbi:hypothetical protein [Mycobacterium sp. DL440]|uniref:hypothetical protein n=1 Tax=Mycobacterium sp. DL440 TaxID=2675523 RepID=UPI0014207A73|nr:hypothetical protein [Mycobacterium sp. DL440]
MSPKKAVVQRLDSSVLIMIWLDGFNSGVASTSKFLLGYSDEAADRLADKLCGHLTGDPAAMEQVRAEVRERLQGVDTGAKNLTVHDANGPVVPGGDE